MRLTKIFLLILLVVLGLSACNMPAGTPDAAATLQAIYTAQAATVEVIQTQSAPSATPLSLPTIEFPTLQPQTAIPSITPLPQNNTPVPTARCDWAAFVKDVSVPDGTIFAPSAQFVKTWRLQNIGSCSWTSSYSLVFVNGNSLGNSIVSLPGTVAPGQTVDVSVKLTAPAGDGSYTGYWLLRNAAGVMFGLGDNAQKPFYVSIKVVGDMTTVFDFVAEYCHADWRSGAGDLGCPGHVNGKKGYAISVSKPQLENGQKYSGDGLLTVPERVNDGYLQGYYQPFKVKEGDRFHAVINCEYLATGCNVIFRLDYQIGNGKVKTFWSFNEIYEGSFYTVDLDLSPLADKEVVFILTVLANGKAEADKPVWVAPHIERSSDLVTPSATPTRTATVTATATRTPTPTVTLTGAPSTATATATVTSTVTSTVTPIGTPTETPTETPTPTATP